MCDEALITLAQHRLEQAQRIGATAEDARQLCDIFPVVLQRLREKVEITRNLVSLGSVDLRDQKGWQRLCGAGERPERDEQLELALALL